jgi:hypothetical protein
MPGVLIMMRLYVCWFAEILLDDSLSEGELNVAIFAISTALQSE